MARICIPLAAGAPLVEARFVARPNQFLVEAHLDGQVVRAHMADRGRLIGLLQPNARLVLAQRTGIDRRTGYQVVAVYAGNEMVSLDTQLPNRLIAAALSAHALPQFARYTHTQTEPRIGAQRFDFRLRNDTATCLLEVKSATQVIDGLAMFPDAPTERGRLQVEALTTLALNGQRVAVLFVVQRSSGRALVPNETIDPRFAIALRRAIMTGVEVYAYRCPVSLKGIVLGPELPVYGSVGAVPAHV